MMDPYEQKVAVTYLRVMLDEEARLLYRAPKIAAEILEMIEQVADELGIPEPIAVAKVDDMDDAAKFRGLSCRTEREANGRLRRARRALCEREQHLRYARPGATERTIRGIAGLFRLDAVDTAIFGLLLRRAMTGLFDGMTRPLKDRHGWNITSYSNIGSEIACIAPLLGMKPITLAERVGSSSQLISTGLIYFDRIGNLVPSNNVFRALYANASGPTEIVAAMLGRPALPEVAWDDFDHVAEHRDSILRIFTGALQRRAAGVHVLIYGPPGTGKTELCKTLAAHLSVPIFSVGESSGDGDEPSRTDRIASYRMCQALVQASDPALIMFDEAEDLFSAMPMLHLPQLTNRFNGSKVFVHRLLEQAAMPTLWTTNNLEALGPAVIRRMTYAAELRMPPALVRARVWRRTLARQGIAMAEDEIDKLARNFPAPPSLVASAVRAAGLTGGGSDDVCRSVASIAKAMNGGVPQRPVSAADHIYDLSLINADADLLVLAEALARPATGRIFSLCLHGPSGTGKTAYVRHLAARVGLEVLLKRASDLLSMWVGQTEKGIAAAFDEARTSGLFLVFDEADSLLQDRSGATRSWEITQVNEMLTWMECHELPFACTTNLMERLDAAALRRFSFKARFDYLTADQRRRAFRLFFTADPPTALDGLDRLTPGDFSVVRRRASILGCLGDTHRLADMLVEECQVKPGWVRPIGFRMAEQ